MEKLTLLGISHEEGVTYQQDFHEVQIFNFLEKHKDSKILNDVVIHLGNENIRSNKLILSSFCGYFEEIFFGENSVKEMKSVKITDAGEIKGVKVLLEYIEDRGVLVTSANVCHLLASSHLMRIHPVKDLCFHYLLKAATVENFCYLLDIGEHYNNTDFLEDMTAFICKNFMKLCRHDSFNSLPFERVLLMSKSVCRYEKAEKKFYDVLTGWWNHKEERAQYFPDLFKQITFHRLPFEFLESMRKNEPLISKNLSCIRLLSDILSNRHETMVDETLDKTILGIGGQSMANKVVPIHRAEEHSDCIYPPLPAARQKGSSTKLNQSLYFIGGTEVSVSEDENATDTVWKMDLEDMEWHTVVPMNKKRHSMCAVAWNGVVAVVGGYGANGKVTKSGEYYSEETNEWKKLPEMRKARADHALVACDEALYVIGGFDGKNILNQLECCCDVSGKWNTAPTMQVARSKHAAVLCQRRIYVIGGLNSENEMERSVDEYMMDTCTWCYVKNIKIFRHGAGAFALNSTMYVVGGCDESGQTVHEIEYYNREVREWMIDEDLGPRLPELQNTAFVAV